MTIVRTVREPDGGAGAVDVVVGGAVVVVDDVVDDVVVVDRKWRVVVELGGGAVVVDGGGSVVEGVEAVVVVDAVAEVVELSASAAPRPGADKDAPPGKTAAPPTSPRTAAIAAAPARTLPLTRAMVREGECPEQ